MRVHWAIPFIPSSAITITTTLDELCKHTHVLSIADEKLSQKGFEGVATGVRSTVMTGDSREVTHIMHVVNPKTCETYELLLTMVGRKPLCLRCRREGHFQCECTTPYCRHHGEYGHSAEGCAAARSYASAARRGSDDPRDSEEEDGVVEGMAPPVSTQTRYQYANSKEGVPSVVSAPLEEIALSEGESDSSGGEDHGPVWQVANGGRRAKRKRGALVKSMTPVVPPRTPAPPPLGLPGSAVPWRAPGPLGLTGQHVPPQTPAPPPLGVLEKAVPLRTPTPLPFLLSETVILSRESVSPPL